MTVLSIPATAPVFHSISLLSFSVIIQVPMGASCSRIPHSSIPPNHLSLGDLAESCVAAILTHLDPPDICRLARLNRAFRNASRADLVWEPKLPDNYEVLVGELVGQSSENLGKRDIFAALCRAKTLCNGTQRVWLDKTTSSICLEISAKALSITGMDDPRYWNHIPTSESRFQSVAYLKQTWWFEVEGEVDFPFPPGTYSLFFRLQLGRPTKRFGHRACNHEHVHGWNLKPVQFRVRTSDGQSAASKCFLNEPGKWVNYHVGDVNVGRTGTSLNVKFSMKRVDCTHTKGGVCVDSLLVYPVEFKERLRHLSS
ncbi:hypothetical protein SAY86_029053 [Trapa natans]|uniref:F-box domain-containing protein n=1 Tax=Trapa natans TaxID=22666 RepID=A0AAN7RBC2_TRANT|nr:hypothetical protein SAY86_029053 [Trapa natans]